MGEKRRSKRVPKRLRVRFGEAGTEGFPHTGLTNDVSSTGLFVVSNQQMKPGTRVHLEVMLPGEKPLFLEGVVARLVQVPVELRTIRKPGFGVRYLTGPELLGELTPQSTPLNADPFTLVFEDESAWRESLEKEFKRGGVFVWCPTAPPMNTTVKVTFDLRFVGQQLSFDAKVVHVMPNPGKVGVALMFADVPAASAALSATVRS